jgi:serine/threonine protein kinase
MHSEPQNTITETVNDTGKRAKYIRNMLKNKSLSPMIELSRGGSDNYATECFVPKRNPKNARDDNDIRYQINKKDLDLLQVIQEIGGKMMYIKSGSTGHTFMGIDAELAKQMHEENERKKQRGEEVDNKISPGMYAVKFVAYKKSENGSIYDIRRPENAEQVMLKILSYFVLNNHTPHIVLPMASFYYDIREFIRLASKVTPKEKKFNDFVTKYEEGEFHDEISVLISEWANGGDLLDYLRKNYLKLSVNEWRVIFFQLLQTLAVIQDKYPTFRHNDLKANNILLHYTDLNCDEDRKTKYYKYCVNNMEFIVPNIGFQIKIWDFDFACIPGMVDNFKVYAKWTKKINVKPVGNRYYDIHYFFNSLTKKAFLPRFWEAEEIPRKVKKFIKRIIPEPYRDGNKVSTDKGRLLENVEFTTPYELLEKDPFFDKFRPKHKTPTSKYSSSSYRQNTTSAIGTVARSQMIHTYRNEDVSETSD